MCCKNRKPPDHCRLEKVKLLDFFILFFFTKLSASKVMRSQSRVQWFNPPPLPHTHLFKHNCNIQISAAGWLWLFRCLVVDLTWWRGWHGQPPREWFSAWGRNGDTPLSHGSVKFSSAGPLRSHTGDLLQCVAFKSPLLASCQTCNNRSLP